MTSETKKIFFALLRSAVSTEALPDNEKAALTDEELQEMYETADRQDIAHLIGYALINNGMIEKGSEIYTKFYAAQFVAICRYESLNNALEQVTGQFEKAQIEYLPLKGAVMRRFYPQPWMRTSSDADILVHEDDFKKIAEIMTADGFEIGRREKKDAAFFRDGCNIEIHFYLVKDNSIPFLQPDYLWKNARRDGFRCSLPDDIFYAYHVEHMKRHFGTGGCGVRFFLDFYILNNFVQHDAQKRRERLAESDSLDFDRGCVSLCDVWFDGAEHTALTEQMERYVFDAGVYGTFDHWTIVQGLQSGSTATSLWRRIWLPYDKLCWSYPRLEGRRYLQPYYEAKRIVQMLTDGRLDRSVAELKANRRTNLSREQGVAAMLSTLGILKKN